MCGIGPNAYEPHYDSEGLVWLCGDNILRDCPIGTTCQRHGGYSLCCPPSAIQTGEYLQIVHDNIINVCLTDFHILAPNLSLKNPCAAVYFHKESQ